MAMWARARPGQFAYYVLALSSEPGFCAAHPKPSQECVAPQGFALHGLWPQLSLNSYPTFCSKVALSADVQARYASIYADPTLIAHEWPKHGTCSGLAPEAYFALSQADATHVVIPAAYRGGAVTRAGDQAALQAALIAANPGLDAAELHIETEAGVVTGITICLTKAGGFTRC